MSHRLTLPFLTENALNLEANQTVMISRLGQERPGLLHVQGRITGGRGRPLTWRASEHDIANMFYTYLVGYRGQLHLPGVQDVWTELIAKINRDGRRQV